MSTILVIDDNYSYRTDIQEILEFENYETLQAHNGLIGLQMVQKYSPDLIVCDVDMPMMNGIEVLRRTKASEQHSNIPFIMLTGHRDAHTMNTAYELGVEKFMTKPFDIGDFLSAITHFLQNKPATLR